MIMKGLSTAFSSVISGAPVVQALHFDRPDFHDIAWPICQTASDDESTSLIPSRELHLPLADLSIITCGLDSHITQTSPLQIGAPPLLGLG